MKRVTLLLCCLLFFTPSGHTTSSSSSVFPATVILPSTPLTTSSSSSLVTPSTPSHRSSDSCDSLNCAFKCQTTPEGDACYCDTGMMVNPSDKRSCIDLDECKEWGYCDQLCANSQGSYKCSCTAGYTLIPPNHCKADNSKYLLVIIAH